jgi:hypothetical protein
MFKKGSAMWIWKVVFILTAFSFLLNALKLPNNFHIITISFLFIEGLTLFPLFGYAYQMAIGSKIFSATIFIINSLIITGGWSYVFFGDHNELSNMGIIGFLIGGVITFLYIYPQFAYAFKSNELWKQSAT